MSPGLKWALILIGTLGLGIFCRIVFPMGTPHVEVAAEDIIPSIGFTNSMLVTLIIDVILIWVAYAATSNMQMVPRGLQNMMEAVIEALYKLFSGINAENTPRAFPIVATIFLFVLVSNLLGLFPGFGSIGLCHDASHEEAGLTIQLASNAPADGLFGAPLLAAEEGKSSYIGCEPGQSLVPLFRPPTTDLNNTLALALISFVLIEYIGFATLGFGYLGKFFINPFGKEGPIMTAVGLLEFISELARLPAFMFRLFGNIFAGEVLILVIIFLFPIALPMPIYLFEVFVSFIQAFIFAVLTMAFISIAVAGHGDEHGEAHH